MWVIDPRDSCRVVWRLYRNQIGQIAVAFGGYDEANGHF
jgi:hypothetical protein